jgi:hypothetical protein
LIAADRAHRGFALDLSTVYPRTDA